MWVKFFSHQTTSCWRFLCFVSLEATSCCFYLLLQAHHTWEWPWASKGYHDCATFNDAGHPNALITYAQKHIQGFENWLSRIKIKLTEVEGPARNAFGHLIVKFRQFWPSVAVTTQNIKHNYFPYLESSSVMLVIFFYPRTFLFSLLDRWATKWKWLSASMLTSGLWLLSSLDQPHPWWFVCALYMRLNFKVLCEKISIHIVHSTIGAFYFVIHSAHL